MYRPLTVGSALASQRRESRPVTAIRRSLLEAVFLLSFTSRPRGNAAARDKRDNTYHDGRNDEKCGVVVGALSVSRC